MTTSFKSFLKENESSNIPNGPKTKEEVLSIVKRLFKVDSLEDDGEVERDETSDFLKINDVTVNDDLSVDFDVARGNISVTTDMLNDGYLPFKFGELNCSFMLSSDQAKSLIGTPKYCSFLYLLNLDKIHNMKYVSKDIHNIQLNGGGFKSLEGCPSNLHILRLLYVNRLTDFSHLPTKVDNISILGCEGFTSKSFKFFPQEVALLTLANPNCYSLHELGKYVKRSDNLDLFSDTFYANIVNCDILSLALIRGLRAKRPTLKINLDCKSSKITTTALAQKTLNEIVQKYVGTGDVIGFQDELLENGFESFARI
jgi:hypothetical protein